MAHLTKNTEQTDYYALLGVARNAEISDIRRRYRVALLLSHPDKHTQSQRQKPLSPAGAVISQLQDAFCTLSDPELRETYDQLLKEGKGKVALTAVNQRPANEISLDEFNSEEVTRDGDSTTRWNYPCRCGSLFMIEERELEEDLHYIGCSGCSEVIWVGYEAIDGVQDQQNESGMP
jgi:diphthamide biosynthesis protein 4